jgi:hypothetical protein
LGSPVASFEHATSSVRSVFAFAGITDMKVMSADGTAAQNDRRAAAICLARLDIGNFSPIEPAPEAKVFTANACARRPDAG